MGSFFPPPARFFFFCSAHKKTNAFRDPLELFQVKRLSSEASSTTFSMHSGETAVSRLEKLTIHSRTEGLRDTNTATVFPEKCSGFVFVFNCRLF